MEQSSVPVLTAQFDVNLQTKACMTAPARINHMKNFL